VAQAAVDLACSRKFIYEAIWSGTLPSLKVGRSLRIDRQDWERFLASLR
jgi:excisionase family DNA binding protein